MKTDITNNETLHLFISESDKYLISSNNNIWGRIYWVVSESDFKVVNNCLLSRLAISTIDL